MAIELTSLQIKEFIKQANQDKPYSDDRTGMLDDTISLTSDSKSVATLAKKILDRYFSTHPEDNIENYL